MECSVMRLDIALTFIVVSDVHFHAFQLSNENALDLR